MPSGECLLVPVFCKSNSFFTQQAAPSINRDGGSLPEMGTVYVTAVLIEMNIALELLYGP